MPTDALTFLNSICNRFFKYENKKNVGLANKQFPSFSFIYIYNFSFTFLPKEKETLLQEIETKYK